MPELPEVETIVNDLKKLVIGKKITDVWIDTPKLIKHPDLTTFKNQIKGLEIKNVSRQGKNILFDLSHDYTLLIHQKMTGHLLYGKWKINGKKVIPLSNNEFNESVNSYIHFILFLDNFYQLALSDLRKFAKIILDKKENILNLKELKKLGPDPLDKNFTFKKFKEVISSASPRAKIKQVLMDQTIIAGIGNIYADEILWWTKIHPLYSIQSLTDNELKKIYQAIKKVLKMGIKYRGASVSDYRDPLGKKGRYDQVRKVYQRENQKCYRCGHIIKRIKIGGRSSCYCPHCQKI
ncbi:MAG TPA: bifunctional DNA-formamidopyrimidine glycosylase/DNA-(apurinic or apyrimidinic site) lyase [Candidatus Paceibacterota bacterium]|nr:bifunctional DNA-formamidopyrimidine glycosylase/DNA-(apurinic or apyrimidinic site) lyase [Parcubacteria group bacterium]HOM33207.1 bifunctional DNA-formamidopyrimidine glycosylase/DNA-(apurinic or apyrimidinic site) lyase [Candidatus Paceibacterota bacterium]